MKFKVVFFVSLFVITGFASCDNQASRTEKNNASLNNLKFEDINYPENNGYTKARWELGRKLFFDPVLSKDSTISCATCHNPQFAFSDNKPTTLGIVNRPGVRNVPTLTNVAYAPYFMQEGGVASLELQVIVPIQEHNEMASDFNEIIKKIRRDSTYVKMAEKAYDRVIDPFVITRAIANFERTIVSDNSDFDAYLKGNKSVLSSAELQGMELFYSNRLNCTSCHSGILFTNYEFENNGLYEVYADSGRMRLTMNEEDRAKFKVPTLRNIELTAPYMHNGSLETLEEVVEHYDKGGKSHPNKSTLIKPLELTKGEKKSLILFLKSLTDNEFF